jgi:hypothetical protein
MPNIGQAILNRLKAWQMQKRLPDLFYRRPGVNDLVRAQDLIGWRAFLEGAVLQAWAAKQQDYYDWLQRRNTGKRWITTLIKNFGKSPETCRSTAMENSQTRNVRPHLENM